MIIGVIVTILVGGALWWAFHLFSTSRRSDLTSDSHAGTVIGDGHHHSPGCGHESGGDCGGGDGGGGSD